MKLKTCLANCPLEHNYERVRISEHLGTIILLLVLVAVAGQAQTTAPAITGISPAFGPVGTMVTVTGSHFGATQGTSTITFNNIVATVGGRVVDTRTHTTISSTWSDTRIVVPVPTAATSGDVVVTVSGQVSNPIHFTVAPVITSISPSSGVFGASVTVNGTNFGATQSSSGITFNGMSATPATWADIAIVVPVPSGSTPGNVVVTVSGVASNGVPFTPSGPIVTSISPTSGTAGDKVTITGAGFGATDPGLYNRTTLTNETLPTTAVTFNGVSASVLSWSDTNITVTVPCGGAGGNVAVSLPGANQTRIPSNGLRFNISLSSKVGLQGGPTLLDGTPPAPAFPGDNPSAHRAQIVFVGDGYRDVDLDRYRKDVDIARTALFQSGSLSHPFSDYYSYLELIRLDVASAQCGATHYDLQPNPTVTNFFSSNYACDPQRPERLAFCANDSLVKNTISDALDTPGGLYNNGFRPRMIIVLANDTTDGGAAPLGNGEVAVLGNGLNHDLGETVLHELGHSFAQLEDEYESGQTCDSQGAPCPNFVFIPAPNTSSTVTSTPWDAWIIGGLLSTPFPGAEGCSNPGVYRPTLLSKMRCLNHDFDQVNSEKFVNSFYKAMLFPDGPSQPATTTPATTQGTTVDFAPAVPNPSSPYLHYAWSLNGLLLSEGDGPNALTYSLDTTTLSPNTYSVSVKIQDRTPLVRNTAFQSDLAGVQNWSLNISCAGTTSISSYQVSYTNAEGASCVDTHQVTDIYNCDGHLVSTDDRVTDTQCEVTCVPVNQWLVQIGPYDAIGDGSRCFDDYIDVEYDCSDGSSFITESFWKTECTNLKLCDDNDPECFPPLDGVLRNNTLQKKPQALIAGMIDSNTVLGTRRCYEHSLDSIHHNDIGLERWFQRGITTPSILGVSRKVKGERVAPACHASGRPS